MKTFRRFEYEKADDLPPEFDSDVRTPEALVEAFLRDYTEEGDRVLDLFAGFGTTLKVAEELDRVAYGVEYEADRVAVIEERVERPENVIRGSAFELDRYDLPTFDCCLTSPPFMVEGMETNPFQNYDGESDYETYLADVREIFAGVKRFVAPDASVLVDVSNMNHEGDVTTLSWDVAQSISDVLHFEGEVVITWDGKGSPDREGNYGYGYDHSYVHVFRNAEE